MSFVSDILGAAKDNAKGGVSDALTNLSQGNVSGALGALSDIPGNLLSNFEARGGASFGDGFSGIHKLRDVVQDWCWYCVLPSIDGTTLPWYYVSSANTPFRKFNTETLQRNGKAVHYVDSYEMSSTLSLKFVLDGSSKAPSYLRTWQKNILWDKDQAQSSNQGIWGLPSGYKKTITIVVMSVARKELLTFKYYGCMPSDVSQLELGAGSPTPLELAVEFQIEDVELTIKNDLGFLESIKDSVKGMAMNALTGGISNVLSSFKSVPSGITSL